MKNAGTRNKRNRHYKYQSTAFHRRCQTRPRSPHVQRYFTWLQLSEVLKECVFLRCLWVSPSSGTMAVLWHSRYCRRLLNGHGGGGGLQRALDQRSISSVNVKKPWQRSDVKTQAEVTRDNTERVNGKRKLVVIKPRASVTRLQPNKGCRSYDSAGN